MYCNHPCDACFATHYKLSNMVATIGFKLHVLAFKQMVGNQIDSSTPSCNGSTTLVVAMNQNFPSDNSLQIKCIALQCYLSRY